MEARQNAVLTVPGTQVLHQAMRSEHGEAVELPAEVKEAMAAQKKKVTDGTGRLKERPDWYQQLVEQNANAREIVEAAIKRGLKKRDHRRLVEVKSVLNELGGTPDGTAEIVRLVTVDVLNQLRDKR